MKAENVNAPKINITSTMTNNNDDAKEDDTMLSSSEIHVPYRKQYDVVTRWELVNKSTFREEEEEEEEKFNTITKQQDIEGGGEKKEKDHKVKKVLSSAIGGGICELHIEIPENISQVVIRSQVFYQIF